MKMNQNIATLLFFHKKMFFHFIKEKRGELFIFTLLISVIIFAALEAVKTSHMASPFLLHVFISTSLPWAAYYYAGPSLNAIDDAFLKKYLNRTQLFIFRAIQSILIGLSFLLLINLISIMRYDFDGQALYTSLIIISIINPITSFFYLSRKKKESNKTYFKNQLLHSKVNASNSIFILQKIYFSRKDLFKNIQKTLAPLSLTTFLFYYLYYNSMDRGLLLLILPPLISIFRALDYNSQTLSQLKSIKSDYRINALKADFLFSSIPLSLILIATLTGPFFLDLNLTLFIIATPAFFITLLYAMVLKYLFIDQRLLRHLALSLSIALPLLIPFFIFQFYKEVKKYDSY